MSKFARVFIRPYGDRWFNLPLRDDQDCTTVFASMRSEGAIIHPDFIVPQEMVHYVCTIVLNDVQLVTAGTAMPWPGQKPN